VDSK